MSTDDKTVCDSGATVTDQNETMLDTGATLPEDNATVYDGVATMRDDAVETVLDSCAAAFDGDATQMSKSSDIIENGATLLDTYRIESDAIEGGMGKVWRVRHTGWNVDLAMKQPKAKLFQSQHQKDNFIHECEAWINLGLHPHTVSCYYVREISGIPAIFSEWMDGGSLKDAIESGSLYDGSDAEQQERLLDIAIQFARGLHYAHECRDENGQPMGLIHQDVKPDNLLLTKAGEAKVADFGISKARAVLTMLGENAEELGGYVDSSRTMYAASGGYTPAYCSMEQMNGQTITRRTDIYSWAVSVMEMYLGERPWTNGVIAGAACENYFPEARVAVPEAMKALLKECLNQAESERPHDFAVVEEKLLAIYKAETGNEYPRPVSKAAADTADSLNNRALSFLDLGKPEEAERCWKRALEINSGHLYAFYNQSLYDWRYGRITDVQAIQKMERLQKSNPTWKCGYLISLLHMERFDYAAASDMLARTLQMQDASDDVRKKQKIASLLNEDYKIVETDQEPEVFSMPVPPVLMQHFEASYSFNGWYIGLRRKGKFVLVYRLSDDPFCSEQIATLIGHEHQVNSVCFSPDGKTILTTGGFDDTIRIWDVNSFACVKTLLPASDGIVSSAKFNSCGSMIVSVDKVVRLWCVDTGRCIRTFDEFGFVNADFSKDGKLLVARNYDGKVFINKLSSVGLERALWQVSQLTTTHETLHTQKLAQQAKKDIKDELRLKNYENALNRLVETEKIPRFAETEEYRQLKRDVGQFCKRSFFAMECPQVLVPHWTDDVTNVCFSPDGEYLLSENKNHTMTLWSALSGKPVRTFSGEHPSTIRIHAISKDNRFALVQHFDRLPFILDITTGHHSQAIDMEKNVIESAYFTADSSHVVIFTRSVARQKVPSFVWNIEKAKAVCRFGETAGFIEKACMNPAETYCFLCPSPEDRNRIDVLNTRRYSFHASCIGHTGKVNAVCVSGNGKYVVSGGEDMTIRIWDINTFTLVRTLSGSKGNVISVMFSPCDRYILSLDGSGGVRLWDAANGSCIEEVAQNAQKPVSMTNDAILFIENGDLCFVPINWKLEYPGLMNIHEDALPYIELFLTHHPDWTNADFNALILELRYRGYGWLNPMDVKEILSKMVTTRKKGTFGKKIYGGA